MKKTWKLVRIITFLVIIGMIFITCDELESKSEPIVLSGTVSINGTAQVGQMLTANISSLSGSGEISYRWKRDGSIIIGTGKTYNVQTADIGYVITLTVMRAGVSGSITSEPTSVITNLLPVLTGDVWIRGIAQVGQTLTAITGNFYHNASGDNSYQWKRGGNTVIGSNSDYIVQTADIGSTITVTVTRSGHSGSITSAPTAVISDIFSGLIKYVSAGGSKTVFIATDGTLWEWDGIMTLDRRSPVLQIGTERNWASVSARGAYAIKTDGTLWEWEYGQHYDGTTVTFYKSRPVQIGTERSWASVSASVYHTVAIATDGTLWAWGENEYGQLGDGTTVNRSSPIQIGTERNWASVSAGEVYTAAIKTDGTLWAWGANDTGQLGDGTRNVDRRSPVQIGTERSWASVSASYNSTAAIATDGTLWEWGGWRVDQYGNFTFFRSPVQKGTERNWASVSAGGIWYTNYCVAIKTDGTLWAWGTGQLSDGTTVDRSSPVQIGTDKNWAFVSAGYWHTAAIATDGTLWAWDSVYSSPVQIGTESN